MLHDWLDQSAGAAIPTEAATHIRDCAGCREFVRHWDRIELGLQSLRDAAPTLSPDFRVTLERAPRRQFYRPHLGAALGSARWAAAAAAAILLLGMTYALIERTSFSRNRASSLAILRPQTGGYGPRAGTLNAEIPLGQGR